MFATVSAVGWFLLQHCNTLPIHNGIEIALPLKPTHRYSSPDADIGWDSDLGAYYLSFSLCNISNYNPKLKINLLCFISITILSWIPCPYAYHPHYWYQFSQDLIPYVSFVNLNDDGVPICMKDNAIIYNGYEQKKHRHKHRCPLVTKKNPIVPIKMNVALTLAKVKFAT